MKGRQYGTHSHRHRYRPRNRRLFLPCAGLRLFRPPGPARRDHHGRQQSHGCDDAKRAEYPIPVPDGCPGGPGRGPLSRGGVRRACGEVPRFQRRGQSRSAAVRQDAGRSARVGQAL